MGEIGSLLGMLLAVAVILFAAWWVTSLIARQGVGAKFFGGISNSHADGTEFCVLRQIPVGRGARLLLVRLQERCLLLGVAQGGVSLLAELTAEEAAPWLNQNDLNGPAAPIDFGRLMRMSTKK